MRNHRQLGTIGVSTLILLAVLTSNGVWAGQPHVALSPPLSPLEQAARLAGVASQAMGRQLFPAAAQTMAPMPYYQRHYRRDWMSTSPYQRTQFAESIGNQGRARYAAEQGWSKLLGSRGRGLRQGPDSVYWDPYSGRVRALEAKGGSSQPKWTYGALQGTNANSIRSAEGVLQSPKATLAEKQAAARLLKAAQRHRLQSGVVKTPHVQGKPKSPVSQGQWDRANVGREARRIEAELIRKHPELAKAFKAANRAQTKDMLTYRAQQGLAALGVVSAVALGWHAYQQSQLALAMFHDPALWGTALPYMQSGIALGMWSEAATLGLGSSASLGRLGQSGLNTFGKAAGKWFLPIAVGVEGLNLAMASYDYTTGRISQRDFYRRSTGPAIFAGFTTGGAIIGGLVGAFAGGAGAAPGAMTGASIGAVVAIPVQYLANQAWNWYYQDFDAHQRQMVDKAVEKFYDLQDDGISKDG